MLRLMIVCALVGMSSAMRADRSAVDQALKQHQNASSRVELEKTAKCCCKDEACSRPLDKDGVQRYQLYMEGKDWCCTSLSKCGWLFGYNTPLENAPGVATFDLSTCEMQVSVCPAGNCPYGEPAIVLATRQTGDSQVCGCACQNGEGPGCDHCGHGYGPKYPICEKKCSQWDTAGHGHLSPHGRQFCHGHGTAVGYGSDCACVCEAGWMPEQKCKFKALQGSECVRKSYVLFAELSDFVSDGRRDHHMAEQLARVYCGSTKDHAESFRCLADTASQCMKTGGGIKAECGVFASRRCVANLR